MAGGGGGSNTTHALLSPDPETLPIGGLSRPTTGEFLETKMLQGQPTVAPHAPSTAGPNSTPGQAASGTMANVTRSHGSNR